MRRSAPATATAFALLTWFCSLAWAVSDPPDVIEWICGLEAPRAESIRCELSEPVPGYYARADYQPPSTQRIATDLFRRGSEVNIARLVREAPDRYAGESWSIPLYAPPENLTRVRELASSVMCGNDRACQVMFVGMGNRLAALGNSR